MDGVTMRTYLEISRSWTQRIFASKFENKKWDLSIFCNSDWDGGPETRISVTDLIVCLMMCQFSADPKHKEE
jgi:hypothetical protein